MCRTARTTVEHQPETAICSCSWSRTLAAVFNTKTQIPSGKWNLITSAYSWNIRYASWQQVWTAVNLVWTGWTTKTHSIVQTHSTTYKYVLSDKWRLAVGRIMTALSSKSSCLPLTNATWSDCQTGLWWSNMKSDSVAAYCMSPLFSKTYFGVRESLWAGRHLFLLENGRAKTSTHRLEGLPTAFWLF